LGSIPERAAGSPQFDYGTLPMPKAWRAPIIWFSSTRRSQMQPKPWHMLAATGVVLLLLLWGLNAEQGQAHPNPLVPYTLVALPILFVSGVVLAVRRRRTVEAVKEPLTRRSDR
jgi:hypothetical protein